MFQDSVPISIGSILVYLVYMYIAGIFILYFCCFCVCVRVASTPFLIFVSFVPRVFRCFFFPVEQNPWSLPMFIKMHRASHWLYKKLLNQMVLKTDPLIRCGLGLVFWYPFTPRNEFDAVAHMQESPPHRRIGIISNTRIKRSLGPVLMPQKVSEILSKNHQGPFAFW